VVDPETKVRYPLLCSAVCPRRLTFALLCVF